MSQQSLGNNDIDLRAIFNLILKNKKIFFLIPFLSFLLGCMNLYLKETTWEGGFQIIISKQKNNSSLDSILGSASPLGLGNILNIGGNSSLKTEVEILKSPSVLLPVFKYVKENKKELGLVGEKWKYSSWLGSLNVELEKGTSILNLNYKDTEKDFIIPVLNKISNAYKEYSNKDRINSLNNGINFLNKQVDLYKTKSKESLKSLTIFARKNDLGLNINEDGTSASEIQVESNRVTATNKIREINFLLDGLNKLEENDIDSIIELASSLESLKNRASLLRVLEIDYALAQYKSNFIKEDYRFKNLKKEKFLLAQSIKKQIRNNLNSELIKSNSIITSSNREKDVIVAYREAINETIRNAKLLQKLEEQRELLLLEKAKKEEPWELITEPTLIDEPIDKLIKVTLVGYLISGIILSIFVILILEKIRNLLYSEEELSELLNLKIITNFSNIKSEQLNDFIEIFSKNLSKEIKGKKLEFITYGEMEDNKLNLFTKIFKKYFKEDYSFREIYYSRILQLIEY